MRLISKLKSLSKYEKYALITIIIAIIIRFSLISTYAVSGDACWHFSASRFMAENFKIPLFEGVGRDEPFWPPPLFHFIASFLYLLFEENGLKLVAPIFGSLTLIISYFLFRRLVNEKSAFYSIFFLSFLPLYIDYNVLGYVESLLTFLIVLSLYFAFKQKYLLSGVVAGLSILSKYNGFFIIPVLLFIVYKNTNKKISVKNYLAVSVLPLIVSSPWLIRNWISMGNPIWPFMNFIFHGIERNSYLGFATENLMSFNTYLATYLGFFGVPDGNYQAFFFIQIPNFVLLLTLYLIATVIFIIPIFFGLRKGKYHVVWYVLLASFAPLFILYVSNVGAFVARMLMPTFLAFAFFYGIGMNYILNKFKVAGKLLFIIILIISLGFVGAEIFKFRLAYQSWNFYQEDFNWIKSNTEKNSIFFAGGQCISYNINRQTQYPFMDNIQKTNYAFVNQDFNLDNKVFMDEDTLDEVRDKGEIIYENKKTKTKIYKFK